jgi:hypothetical protein
MFNCFNIHAAEDQEAELAQLNVQLFNIHAAEDKQEELNC